MHFDDRHIEQAQRVEQSDGCVGIGGCIDCDTSDLSVPSLNPFDEFAFGICLAEVDIVTASAGMLATSGFDVGERFPAIYFWFPDPKHVEVRSIENQYGR